MVLYRKYRPQTLDELIGQTQVKTTLVNAFQSGKLSHAYLFVGPRGTGKTSTARILAKMVNCENQAMQQSSNAAIKQEKTALLHSSIANNPKIPCNKCQICLSITDGSNLDLIEIDAASNRGIDDIRSLRENIKLAPSAARKKVYIIDEVHMLTTEAFNALLKTLEEPPEHTLFILATTEAAKVPQTILSRVTRLDFKLANVLEITEALKRVIDGEKIKIDQETLKFLAKAADGSFRDGVKLLDQIASLDGEVKIEQVQAILQTSDFSSSTGIIYALARKDTKEAISLILKQLERGATPKNLLLMLMEQFRYLVLIKNGLGTMVHEEVGSDKFQALADLSERFFPGEMIKCLDKLQEAIEKQKTASIPSLPLELAVVEICQESEKGRVISEKSEETNEKSLTQPTAVVTEIGDVPELSKIKEKWTFILETIRQDNFSLEALLRNVKILECDKGVVSIEVPYAFHQRILESPKSRNLLEAVLSDVLGQPQKVSVVLGTRPTRIEDIANVELAADDEIVSLASDIFNGKLID